MSRYIHDLSLLKWKSINEIPNFPFENYDDLIESIKEHKYLLLLDNSKANAISPFVLSKASDLVNIVLSWLPFIIVLVSIIIGFISGKYLFTLGVIISITSFLLSRPSGQWGFTTIDRFPFSFLVAIGIIYFLSEDISIQAWNISSLIIPFIAGNYYYAKNLKAVQKASMIDEPLFLYLYQQSSIELINIDSGDSYMYMPDDEDLTDYVKRQADFDNP